MTKNKYVSLARQKLSHIFTKIAFKPLRTNLFNIVLLAFFLTIGCVKIYSQELGTKTTSIPIKKQTDAELVTKDGATIADTIKTDSILPKKQILD